MPSIEGQQPNDNIDKDRNRKSSFKYLLLSLCLSYGMFRGAIVSNKIADNLHTNIENLIVLLSSLVVTAGSIAIRFP